MTTTFTPNTPAYLPVVRLTVSLNGGTYQGSGILISPDEVLTASHMVSEGGQDTPVSSISVQVGVAGTGALGTYSATDYHFMPTSITETSITTSDEQNDYALIHLSKPVDGVGTMGLGVGYSLGGPATTTGFPANGFGYGESDHGTASPLPGYTVLQIPYLGAGSSGGAAWISNSNGTGAVVAVTSAVDPQDQAQWGAEVTTSMVQQLQAWMHADGENVTLSNLGAVMATSDQNGAVVANLYEGILGRVPDSAGLVFYHSAVDSGAISFAQAASYMLASPEFTSAHGGETDAQFVQQLYQGDLGRAGSASEISFYTSAIAAGDSRSTIATFIADSPEAIAHVQSWLLVA